MQRAVRRERRNIGRRAQSSHVSGMNTRVYGDRFKDPSRASWVARTSSHGAACGRTYKEGFGFWCARIIAPSLYEDNGDSVGQKDFKHGNHTAFVAGFRVQGESGLMGADGTQEQRLATRDLC